MSVCVCVCIVYMCVQMHMHVCTRVWRSKVNIGCVPHYSVLFLKVKSRTVPETPETHLGRLLTSKPWRYSCLFFHRAGIMVHPAFYLFLVWALEIQLRSSYLHGTHLANLAIFSIS